MNLGSDPELLTLNTQVHVSFFHNQTLKQHARHHHSFYLFCVTHIISFNLHQSCILLSDNEKSVVRLKCKNVVTEKKKLKLKNATTAVLYYKQWPKGRMQLQRKTPTSSYLPAGTQAHSTAESCTVQSGAKGAVLLSMSFTHRELTVLWALPAALTASPPQWNGSLWN